MFDILTDLLSELKLRCLDSTINFMYDYEAKLILNGDYKAKFRIRFWLSHSEKEDAYEISNFREQETLELFFLLNYRSIKVKNIISPTGLQFVSVYVYISDTMW